MSTENNTPTKENKEAEGFDLGEYMPKDTPKATKPRVHDFSSSACIGCEG